MNNTDTMTSTENIMKLADEMMCHQGREDYHFKKAALLEAVLIRSLEVQELKTQRDAWEKEARELLIERNMLQAKIEVLMVQEPIGDIRKGVAYFFNGMYTDKPDLPDGALLYAATGAHAS